MNYVKLLKPILTKIVRCTPKFRICVLRGYPSYEDNLIAIYDQLLLKKIQKIVWVVDDLNELRPFRVDPSTKFVVRGSWRDYFYSIFSKYLFITHGHFIDQIPSNQFCTNLWHGIPYKVIGNLDGKNGRSDTMVVATSELSRDIFTKSFGVDRSKVLITGQARTDRFFVSDRFEFRQRLFPGISEETKIFLWLPTFRTTKLDGHRCDGRDFGNIFNCSDFPSETFNRFLFNNNAVCLIKPHPMASLQNVTATTNIKYVDDNWLHAKNLTLYQVAGVADCLISDISSIIIDFMLLDRPIVLLFEDIFEYEENRGFSFKPIADWLPAPVNLNYEKFILEIEAVIKGQDRYNKKRNELKSQFFTHTDNRSTARILEHVFGDFKQCSMTNRKNQLGPLDGSKQ